MLLVNTFDVEPWWTAVPSRVDVKDWSSMAERCEAPMQAYLDLCDEARVKSTFFFLGWYARRYPEHVREAVTRGHQIGCHSLHHEDVAGQTTDDFRRTTTQAKAMIEDAAGVDVLAYRAPSFSFPPARAAELLQVLVELGFTTDSSITTAGRFYGGGYDKQQFSRPGSLKQSLGVDIFEVPVPGVSLAGRDVTIFGGGYLRLAPRILLNRIARHQDYQVLYMHPHDFDPDMPDLPGAGPLTQIRRRLHVGDTRRKLLDLYANAAVVTCAQLAAMTATNAEIGSASQPLMNAGPNPH